MSVQWTVATEESTGEVGAYATTFTFSLASLLDASGLLSGSSLATGSSSIVGDDSSSRGTASFTLVAPMASGELLGHSYSSGSLRATKAAVATSEGFSSVVGSILISSGIYLSLVSKTGESVELSWTSGGTWDEYQVERDGVLLATVSIQTYTDTGLFPSTEYTYRVRGKDTL